jgi:hypothetical protein
LGRLLAQPFLLLLVHANADQPAGNRARRRANQSASFAAVPGPPMAAPETAPMAPPIKAPVPVLFCVPLGFWQPVNPTAEAANAKVKTCGFIIQKSISSDNKRHLYIQKSTRRGRFC